MSLTSQSSLQRLLSRRINKNRNKVHTSKMMSEYQKDGSESNCFGINMYEKNYDVKSNITGTNYKLKDEANYAMDSYNNTGKNEDKLEEIPRKGSIQIKVYKKRFLMLFLFALCSMMNGLPQFQYTVVADIVACYYKVSVTQVNWTCVVYMIAFIPLVLPVTYLMDKKGLKWTLLGGAFLNCLGSWIQCASFSPNRYAVIMVSQTIYAMGQVFVLSLPPFIAGLWFGAGEVGLACALGVFGNQLGAALGFIIPPMSMTNNCKDKVDITYELSLIGYPMAVVNTVLFVVILLVFEEKPPTFPSVAQATKGKDTMNYGASLKSLFKDVPYVLLLIAYGLITGTYFAMSTLMNEMVLVHFPGEEVDAGWLGAIMVFAGMAGSVFLGVILDRTHKFKEISLFVFIISFLFLVCYTGLIQLDNYIWVQFLFFTLLGFMMTGYLPVGLDFGAEITYPQSEAMSASLLNASIQVFSIIMTNIASALLQSYGDMISNIFFCCTMFLGIIITGCIKCELKRSNADDLKPQ